MSRDVIIALDFPCSGEAEKFLELFGNTRPYVKIGMELFFSEGERFIEKLRERGHEIFLDLKLCDIPNTVFRAVKALSELRVSMINLHAFGGVEMMDAARCALEEESSPPLLIAVTVLTSVSSKQLAQEMHISGGLSGAAIHFANLASKCRLDGVVCSPLEAGLIKAECGKEFLAITPGIRFSESKGDDQSRVTTPENARILGADYIVVGRPITRNPDPVAVYERCIKEFLG